MTLAEIRDAMLRAIALAPADARGTRYRRALREAVALVDSAERVDSAALVAASPPEPRVDVSTDAREPIV